MKAKVLEVERNKAKLKLESGEEIVRSIKKSMAEELEKLKDKEIEFEEKNGLIVSFKEISSN